MIPYSLYDISNWNNTVGYGWQAFPKIKFYGSFFYGLTTVNSNLNSMGERPDSNFLGGHISANGDLSENLEVSLQLGYQRRSFDRLTNFLEKNNHELPIFQANIDYKYTEKGGVVLSYKRGGNVSVENPNTAVESDFLTLSINQMIGTSGKLRGTLGFAYQLDTYQTEDSIEYEFIRFNTGISYGFNQWMRCSLNYGLDLLNTNQANIDYKSNMFKLVFSVGY